MSGLTANATSSLQEAVCRWAHPYRWKGGWRATSACRQCADFTAELLASGVVQPREDAVREAMLAARDAWQWGEWANAPRCADRVQERIANAQHVTDWLTARAALAGTGATTQGGA